MTERKLVPHIRFKGLEEEWETKKLEEFSKIVGGGTPDTNKTDYWNGSINWYSPTEIGKKPYVYSSNKKITELGLKKSSAKIHPANTTILFTSRAGIGDMAILKKPAATNQGFQSIELNDNVSPYFIYSYGFMIKNKAERLASGSTFLEISKRDMKRIALKLPTLKEQQKIGDLFAKLDRLLDLQHQKLDQLELLKKALLQKLFPKQDAKIPELRFKGFEEEWKTLKFLNFVEKNSQKNKNLSNTNVESISNKTGFTKQSEQFDGYRVASSDLSNYYVIKEKQFAYNPSRINVGSIAYKKIGEKESVVSPLYVSFSTKSIINNQFLWFWFKTQLFTEQRTKLSEGGVRDTLPFENLKQMHIKAPKLSEQQKIGNLLAKVDHLIELENKKFDNLKKVKKSLLQNMFVE